MLCKSLDCLTVCCRITAAVSRQAEMLCTYTGKPTLNTAGETEKNLPFSGAMGIILDALSLDIHRHLKEKELFARFLLVAIWMDYNQQCLACYAEYCDHLRTYLLFRSLSCGPWGPLIMTSAWSLMWVVCGLMVWFTHTHAASVSPNLLMTTSDPTTDEQPINPEQPTDPPSNNTGENNW